MRDTEEDKKWFTIVVTESVERPPLAPPRLQGEVLRMNAYTTTELVLGLFLRVDGNAASAETPAAGASERLDDSSPGDRPVGDDS
jgi:hypothetical protein